MQWFGVVWSRLAAIAGLENRPTGRRGCLYCGLLLMLCVAPPLRAEPVTVVASVEPLAMLLREVFAGAGLTDEQVRVSTLMLPSQTPHHSALTPSQLRLAQQASLLIWVGAAAEPALARLLARRSGATLAMLSLDGIIRRQSAGDDGPHHDSDHDAIDGGLDPHLWLAPDNMLLLAQALPAQAEILGLPAAQLEQGVNRFADTLTRRRAEIDNSLKPLRDRRFLSQHDAWGYFTDAFHLTPGLAASQQLELSPGSQRFIELIATVERQDIQCVLAEPEARWALLMRVCRGQCRIIEADPLGRHITHSHYSDFLVEMGFRFQACLSADQ